MNPLTTKNLWANWSVISHFVYTLERLGLALPTDVEFCIEHRWDIGSQEETDEARRNDDM